MSDPTQFDRDRALKGHLVLRAWARLVSQVDHAAVRQFRATTLNVLALATVSKRALSQRS